MFCLSCCAHVLQFVSYLIVKQGVIQRNWRPELEVSQASPAHSLDWFITGRVGLLVKPGTVLLQLRAVGWSSVSLGGFGWYR